MDETQIQEATETVAVSGGSNLATIGKNGRIYPRKFDHEEARRRFKRGENIADLAHELGVTWAAVSFAVDRHRRNANLLLKAEQMSSHCATCGEPCSWNRYQQAEPRCLDCFDKARTTSVRENELLCFGCRNWKPDNDFPHSAARHCHKRRGRHNCCRVCGSEMKRAWRERTKVLCSHGCGTLVHGKNRKHPEKPPECGPCSHARIQRELANKAKAA